MAQLSHDHRKLPSRSKWFFISFINWAPLDICQPWYLQVQIDVSLLRWRLPSSSLRTFALKTTMTLTLTFIRLNSSETVSCWSIVYADAISMFFCAGQWCSFSVCIHGTFVPLSRVSSGCYVRARPRRRRAMKSCMLAVTSSCGAEDRQKQQVPYRCYAASLLTHLSLRSVFFIWLMIRVTSCLENPEMSGIWNMRGKCQRF